MDLIKEISDANENAWTENPGYKGPLNGFGDKGSIHIWCIMFLKIIFLNFQCFFGFPLQLGRFLYFLQNFCISFAQKLDKALFVFADIGTLYFIHEAVCGGPYRNNLFLKESGGSFRLF